MVPKVGTFLILIGALLVGLFLFSDMAQDPQVSLLFYGFVSIVAGMIMRWTHPAPPPPPSGRFSLLKRKEKQKKQRERQN